MAFNFNWSPLVADTSRAREMLTAALNKSPKPAIIVDDIIVTELNLGSIPPELEILEIGDLAEDRFRGIFKMQYSGDAFLTLKTRVQANPLNTYLSTKPAFASPQPLAAASGLTIPLQITLSDIKLLGFVILVFSRQKGITLVFRNDPVDSLKVSSTFDSIPFVRDYLQKEIEGQLRLLFMEDLPAIIHRLSLRLWSPDHASQPDINSARVESPSHQKGDKAIDPLSSPSQAPRDLAGRPIEDHELSFSLQHEATPHASFSQKNLLRLAALTDSHRTLSLFTPPINDVVFRAWAGAAEGRDTRRLSTAHQPQHSSSGTGIRLASPTRNFTSSLPSRASSIYSFSSDPGAEGARSQQSHSSRPTLISHTTTSHAFSASGALSSVGRSSMHQRKRRHRVVNLRRPPATAPLPEDDSKARLGEGIKTDLSSRPSTPTSFSMPGSASWASSSEREGEMQTPPDSPERRAEAEATPQARPRPLADGSAVAPAPKSMTSTALPNLTSDGREPTFQNVFEEVSRSIDDSQATIRPSIGQDCSNAHSPNPYVHRIHSRRPGPLEMPPSLPRAPKPSSHTKNDKLPVASPGAGAQPGGILEQAWMLKMAAEIGKRIEAEKTTRRAITVNHDAENSAAGNEAFWNGRGTFVAGTGAADADGKEAAARNEEHEDAPPAYAA